MDQVALKRSLPLYPGITRELEFLETKTIEEICDREFATCVVCGTKARNGQGLWRSESFHGKAF